MRRNYKRKILSIIEHPTYPFRLIAIKQEVIFEFLSNPFGGLHKVENSLIFTQPGNHALYFLNETKKCASMRRLEVTPTHLTLCIKLFKPSPETIAELFEGVVLNK